MKSKVLVDTKDIQLRLAFKNNKYGLIVDFKLQDRQCVFGYKVVHQIKQTIDSKELEV